jgi:hypothetical protein
MANNKQQIHAHVSGDLGDDSNDFIGGFNGYLRRSQPSAKGILAQFYGEDGADADMLLSLSMTKFQNQHVRTSVYWVKDAVGSLKKQPAGYPLIANFESFIRRSIPKSTGMMATLFAPNGVASDAANELNLSKYLDSFVHVRLHRFIADSVEPLIEPDFLDKSIALPFHMATSRPAGVYKEAAKILQIHGFFRHPLVWAALGGEPAYEKWLADRPCCAAISPACQEIGQPILIPNSSYENYKYLPLCNSHSTFLTKNISAIGGKHALELRRGIMLNEWAVQSLCLILKTASLSETSPLAVVTWAASNGVDVLLPAKYSNQATSTL